MISYKSFLTLCRSILLKNNLQHEDSSWMAYSEKFGDTPEGEEKEHMIVFWRNEVKPKYSISLYYEEYDQDLKEEKTVIGLEKKLLGLDSILEEITPNLSWKVYTALLKRIDYTENINKDRHGTIIIECERKLYYKDIYLLLKAAKAIHHLEKDKHIKIIV